MLKMRVLMATFAPLWALPAMAHVTYAPGQNQSALRSPLAIQQSYQHRLMQLRKQMLEQRIADGGELSVESRLRFQRTLDQLNRDRLRSLHNADFWSVDATGKSTGS